MNYFIILLLFPCISTRQISNFRHCESPSGQIISVDISPCQPVSSNKYDIPGSCRLIHNTTVKLSIEFKAKVNTTKVEAIVHGILPGGFINVILSNRNEDGIRFQSVDKDACAQNNVDHCNLIQGETLRYSNAVFIKPVYPPLRLTVKWEIRDDLNRNLACLLIPVEIIS